MIIKVLSKNVHNTTITVNLGKKIIETYRKVFHFKKKFQSVLKIVVKKIATVYTLMVIISENFMNISKMITG